VIKAQRDSVEKGWHGIITLFQNGKVPPDNFHIYTQMVIRCDKGSREMTIGAGPDNLSYNISTRLEKYSKYCTYVG
jgi:hypothetical protein